MEEKYGHYNDDTEKKNRLGMNVVFGMIMIAIYLGMAYLLLFTSLFSNLYAILWAVYLPYMEYSEDIDCLLE